MINTAPVIAIVPVKDTSTAKQRLAEVLSQSRRSALALAMLEDVLAALVGARGLAGILVITPDEDAQRLARRYGARVSEEASSDGHTGAVMGAARYLAAHNQVMLTVPGDVPLATSDEIEQVIDTYRRGSRFTIVPARDEQGSNTILAAPADAVPLRFGEDSFYPHLDAARSCGIEPVVLKLAGIGHDIDTPEDLAAFLAKPSRTHARALLDITNAL
jgi:2-phospho-L-lactate/phosphoenolpyruvate guanylyltransferase